MPATRRRRPPSRQTREVPVASSGPLGDLPWWARFVVWVGLPTAACVAFMWLFFTRFEAVAIHLQQEAERSWQIVSIVQRICLNTATSPDDRLACVSISYPPEPVR